MKVTLWGTRGSIPTPLGGAGVREKLVKALVKGAGLGLDTEDKARDFVAGLPFPERSTFGGNSSCAQIETGMNEYLICDMGTGVREFGNAMLATHGPGRPQTYNILMSHVHWDHIMGFPFFVPGYIPGNHLRIHGCHAQLEYAFRNQQTAPCFPVEYTQLGARIEFVTLEPDQTYDICGFKVTPKLQLHGNDSYGYRLEKDGKIIVYATDSEHKLEDIEAIERVIEFFRDADVVIFDSMYSLADAASLKEDWGHSSNVVGVELCQQARAKHLIMYHHEPVFDDYKIQGIFEETLRYEEITRLDHHVTVTAAYDGLVVDI